MLRRSSTNTSSTPIPTRNKPTPTTARSLSNFDGAPTIDLTDVLNNMGLSYPNGGLAPGAPTFTTALITTTTEPASLAAILPAIFLLHRKNRASKSPIQHQKLHYWGEQ